VDTDTDQIQNGAAGDDRYYAKLRTADIQGNFLELKIHLASQKLRTDLCLHESGQQRLFNVLAQNARYVETAFKRLSAVNIADLRVTDLEDIF
jgi:hypothetical protein